MKNVIGSLIVRRENDQENGNKCRQSVRYDVERTGGQPLIRWVPTGVLIGWFLRYVGVQDYLLECRPQ